jgi:hypothetical protein
MWAEFGQDLLLGYEYRACIKLATIEDPAEAVDQAFQRVCVDLTTLAEVGRFDYHPGLARPAAVDLGGRPGPGPPRPRPLSPPTSIAAATRHGAHVPPAR